MPFGVVSGVSRGTGVLIDRGPHHPRERVVLGGDGDAALTKLLWDFLLMVVADRRYYVKRR